MATHGPVPGAPRPSFTALSTSPPPNSKSDPYHGQEPLAKLAARFITHLFACPDDPPASTQSQAKLPYFIAYALYRTKLHSAMTFAALVLIQRLKARFPSARGSSGHRLFISAYMIASKVMCDDTYSNKSWCIVAQNLFTLREINQMEREMCEYLDWDLCVDDQDLFDVEKAVKEDFREDRDRRTYPNYPTTFVSKRAARAKASTSNTPSDEKSLTTSPTMGTTSPRTGIRRRNSPVSPTFATESPIQMSHDLSEQDTDEALPELFWNDESSDVSLDSSVEDDSDNSNLDAHPEDPFPTKNKDVQMFSHARNISIRDTEIHNAGGDITIHHNYFYQEPQWSSLLSWQNLGSCLFHFAAETNKEHPPLGSSLSSEINLKLIKSKTTMCVSGGITQILLSIRYSFY